MTTGEFDANSLQQAWTIRRMLEWTTKHLEKHGSDTPRLDAEVMLANVLGYQRIQLYTNFDVEPTDAERARMKDLVQRRANHEPVAYLVGHREFYGLDFFVTPDVLIPRPETETLVLEAVEFIRSRAAGDGEGKTSPQLLEIGIGSGCVSVSMATNLPGSRITATDVSTNAIAVAQRNIVRHGLTERVAILEGSCFEPLDDGSKFDLIVSNPPYVTDGEYGSLQYEIRLHEPKVALTAGEDGLDVIRVIVDGAASRLKHGGGLMIELDPAQAAATEDLMRNVGLDEVRTICDLNGQARVVAGVIT